MSPRPPYSTLFPYTTLFRSDVKQRHVARSLIHVVVACSDFVNQRRATSELVHVISPRERFRPQPSQPSWSKTSSRTRGTPSDRKSTRLNSSHANISYAVFCL